MTGTELEIIPPERSEIAGSDAERQPSLQTTARTDLELLAVWLKSHVDGSRADASARRSASFGSSSSSLACNRSMLQTSERLFFTRWLISLSSTSWRWTASLR